MLVANYMVETGIDVTEDYPSAKLMAFRYLMVKSGHWKTKNDEDGVNFNNNSGRDSFLGKRIK